MIERTSDGRWICPYCKQIYSTLATHTRQAHNKSSYDLKKEFEYPLNTAFEHQTTTQKRRLAALRYNMGEQLKRVGARTRFVTGHIQDDKQKLKIKLGHINASKVNYGK